MISHRRSGPGVDRDEIMEERPECVQDSGRLRVLRVSRTPREFTRARKYCRRPWEMGRHDKKRDDTVNHRSHNFSMLGHVILDQAFLAFFCKHSIGCNNTIHPPNYSKCSRRLKLIELVTMLLVISRRFFYCSLRVAVRQFLTSTLIRVFCHRRRRNRPPNKPNYKSGISRNAVHIDGEQPDETNDQRNENVWMGLRDSAVPSVIRNRCDVDVAL